MGGLVSRSSARGSVSARSALAQSSEKAAALEAARAAAPDAAAAPTASLTAEQRAEADKLRDEGRRIDLALQEAAQQQVRSAAARQLAPQPYGAPAATEAAASSAVPAEVGLDEGELAEMLRLHSNEPERWGAPALSTRFAADEGLVAAFLAHAAPLYREVPANETAEAPR